MEHLHDDSNRKLMGDLTVGSIVKIKPKFGIIKTKVVSKIKRISDYNRVIELENNYAFLLHDAYSKNKFVVQADNQYSLVN